MNNVSGINEFFISKNGKNRVIVCYSNDKEGRGLKQEHKKVLHFTEKYPSSKYSYAYKKGICTKTAFEPHFKSKLFIKLDIKNFFTNITYSRFLQNVKIENILLKDRLFLCFYDNHLPLGFITSPKLSDIYMYEFDKSVEEYLSKHKELHYSRYCDDILISSEHSNFGSLHTFFDFIKNKLKQYELTVNEQKTREFDLSKHTSVSFLGLNLSVTEDSYRITLSKTFILKTLDFISDAYEIKEKINEMHNVLVEDYRKVRFNNKNNNIDNDLLYKNTNMYLEYNKKQEKLKFLKSVIKSRVGYIKFNSRNSYDKFLKKHLNRFGKAWGDIWL